MKILTFTILQHLLLALKIFTIFYSILGFDSASGADQQYEACLPRDCGNGVNISFPFYIPNLQDSSCGYPGFEINCNGTYPVLYLPESHYVVDQIFYRNQSVHVYNLASLSTSDIPTKCDLVKSIRNTSLPSGELRLGYDGNVTDLYLFSNCQVNSWTSDNFMNHAFACKGFGAVMLGGDESLSVALRDCETNVIAPVEMLPGNQLSNSSTGSDYAEVLRKGFVLNWKENDCDSCKKSGGNCGFNDGFRCFCPDRPHAKTCNDKGLDPTAAASPEAALLTGSPEPLPDHKEIKGETIFSKPLNKGIMIIAVIGIVGFAMLMVLACFFMYILRKYKFKYTTQQNNEIELNLNPGPQLYKYSYLKKITNSFDKSNKLGKGGYGSVYKGTIPGGREVAVKMLSDSVTNIEDFKNEVSSISRTSHINIVTLLGFCYEDLKRALVYEFMPNGSLSRCISKNASSKAEHELGLEKKLEIAIGIARGLEYLHKGCAQGILHMDLKPANILLDKEWKPKISDFGLAKLFTGSINTREMTNPRGTIGYFAPESYSKNVFSTKSDVYSYGLIVLEMVVGKEKNDPGIHSSAESYFPEWIYRRLEQNTSTCLAGIVSEDKFLVARRMLIVGLWCIQTDPKNRPTISRVLEMLQGSMESLEIPTHEPYSSPTPAANTSTSGSKFHTYSLPAGAAIVPTSGSKFHSYSLPAGAANVPTTGSNFHPYSFPAGAANVPTSESAANVPTSESNFHSYSLSAGARDVPTSGSKFHSYSLPLSAPNV